VLKMSCMPIISFYLGVLLLADGLSMVLVLRYEWETNCIEILMF